MKSKNPRKKKKVKFKTKESEVGELRQDLVTGKWSVVATGRAKRPHDFSAERPKPRKFVKVDNNCPFCRLDLFPQQPDVLRLPDDPEEWLVHIFPNKYPAFSSEEEFRTWNQGPYRAMESVGWHEVLATRWHNQVDSMVTVREMSLQIEALVLRYRQLRQKPAVNHIQIMKNHGPEAGGSLEHPHHQIFTVPVLPSDVHDLLQGAERYAQAHGHEPFGVMLEYEREEGTRIVEENEYFTAWCPYASRVPFEVWIMPRHHEPYFENIGPEERDALAEIMRNMFRRIYVGLNDPPYNYYIHSAPCDETGFVCDRSQFSHFRWHMQILPRMNVWGGFELGTGLEITTALPEESAAYLREQKIDDL